MLIEHTLFGVVDKVADAIKLLRDNEPPEGYYLCFSSSKDSVVIYELAKLAGVKFDAYHNVTTVEPPELMKFIRDNYPDVIKESPRRAKRPQVDIDKNGKKLFVHVIKNWSLDDVWQFIRERNLPYCSLYDEGFSRIGCVLCPFANYEKALLDMEMFPAITDYYRRACRKSFEVNRDKLRNWKSGDDMFDWWIKERRGYHVAVDCNSVPLFSEDDGSIL